MVHKYRGESIEKGVCILQKPTGLPVLLCFSLLCHLDYHTAATLTALLVTKRVAVSPYHQVILHDASWCPTIHLSSDTVYLEMALDPTSSVLGPSGRLSPTSGATRKQ